MPWSFKNYEFRDVLFFYLGVFFFCCFILSAIYETAFYLTAKRADGEVVRLNAGRAHVEIRFVTDDGKVVEYPQNGFVRLDLGEKVKVLYDQQDGGRLFACVDSVGAAWFCTIFTFVFSMFIFFFIERSPRKS